MGPCSLISLMWLWSVALSHLTVCVCVCVCVCSVPLCSTLGSCRSSWSQAAWLTAGFPYHQQSLNSPVPDRLFTKLFRNNVRSPYSRQIISSEFGRYSNLFHDCSCSCFFFFCQLPVFGFSPGRALLFLVFSGLFAFCVFMTCPVPADCVLLPLSAPLPLLGFFYYNIFARSLPSCKFAWSPVYPS